MFSSYAIAVVFGLFIGYYLLKRKLRQYRILGLSSKYVLVTGCDSGFGNLLVKRLDSLGINVFAMCYTMKGITDFQEMNSKCIMPLKLDVTNQDSVDQAFKEVQLRLPFDKGIPIFLIFILPGI